MKQEMVDRQALGARMDVLLAQVASGDRSAFEALYQGSAALLLGVCLRLLPDRAEAEEVLQDTYVAVWQKAGLFDPARAGALTWMATIARNRAIDRLRAAPAPHSRAPLDLADGVEEAEPQPPAQAEAAHAARRLANCLAGLEPQRRRLIRTAFFEGATYEELAERSGSPLGTVKSWIRRGLLQLRACLEGSGT